MAETGGTRRTQLGAAGGESFKHMRIDEIVDEDADGGKPHRQRCRTWSEESIEIDELVSVTGVQLIEQRALVVLRAEHCNPHPCTTTANAPRSRMSRPGSARR